MSAVRGELDALVRRLGEDEVRVLTRIARRLAIGQGTYGALELARDKRAFREKEAREEIEDALVYFACAWLVDEMKKGGIDESEGV